MEQIIKDLWDKAWNVEKDETKNRSDEAELLFSYVFQLIQKALKLAP